MCSDGEEPLESEYMVNNDELEVKDVDPIF
jgi:hypothetical protein